MTTPYCPTCGAPSDKVPQPHDCFTVCAQAWIQRHDVDPDVIGAELLRQWTRQRPRWPTSLWVRHATADFIWRAANARHHARTTTHEALAEVGCQLASPTRDLDLAIDLQRLEPCPVAASCLDGMTTREAAQEHHTSAPTAWRRWERFQRQAMEALYNG